MATLNNTLEKQQKGTPSAPFVTDTNAWTKLGLKVALKEAVAQGIDKIAWTTGEQQNERYDLSKQVDYIQHEDGFGSTKYVDISTPNGLITFQIDKQGKILENKNQQVPESIGKNLADVIGKDVTEKILNATKGGRLEGEGLKVGGKGMKGFYGEPSEGKELRWWYLNDEVTCFGKHGWISGFTGTSHAYIVDSDGQYIRIPNKTYKSVTLSKITRICHNNTWRYFVI